MGKSKSSRVQPLEKNLRLRIAKGFAFVCIVLFPLWQGSFFPRQFLLMIVLLLIAFVLFGKSLPVSKEAAFLFGITVLYGASLLILSENRNVGLIEMLRTLVFPLALLFFYKFNSAKAEKAIFISLMIIAVLGLLAFFSIIHIPGGVIESSNRLQSVIQYANTTALLMLIGILYSVQSYKTDKKIGKLICLLIFAAAFFLTGSRTALVIGLTVCSLYAMIISGRRGKMIVAGSLILLICAIVCLNIFTDIRMFRISIFEATLVERLVTFQDAIRIVRGYPVLGIGAGNWQHWQFLHQSVPYEVKYIHNYYLQLLLDGGVLAPLLFLAAMLPAVIKGIRIKSIHAFILIAVMLQAFLDFDLIFSAVAAITMFSLSRLTTPGKTLNIGKLRFFAIVPLLAVLALWCFQFYS